MIRQKVCVGGGGGSYGPVWASATLQPNEKLSWGNVSSQLQICLLWKVDMALVFAVDDIKVSSENLNFVSRFKLELAFVDLIQENEMKPLNPVSTY